MKLQSQQGKAWPLALLTFLTLSVNAEVSVHGFTSVVLGVADNDAGLLGYDSDFDFQPDSVAGLQIDYIINNRMDATLQLMSRGDNSWEPELEWAYLTYTLDNSAMIRTGKLRGPVFLYSDYLDVGYAQPFLRPISSMYDLMPFSTYTGIDTLWPVLIGESKITIHPFTGVADAALESGESLRLRNLLGANLSWERNNWLVRGIIARTEVTSDDTDSDDLITATIANLLNDKSGLFTGIGFRYDSYKWLLVGEYGRIEVDGAYCDIDGAYLGLGYHIGEFTPYVVAGMSKTQDDEERVGTGLDNYLTFERNEYSLGVRWDWMPKVALKADVTLLNNFNDTAGVNYGLGNEGGDYDSATIFAIGIDTTF